MRTLFVLLDKEFRQFFRNAFLPKVVIVFPLVVMLVMPLVMTMDVRHIGVSVVDSDRSSASGRLIQKIGASDYFTLYEVAEDYAMSLQTLENGKVDVIVEIPDGFEQGLAEGAPEKVSISADGVNAVKGSLGMQYMVQTVMQTMSELRGEQGLPPATELVTVRNMYNQTLEYRHYMIPGLMIMLLVMICGFMPALNLVSEKEIGTIEQINVTPVSRLTFTLAKLIPYWIIGLVVLAIGMLLAWVVYGLVPSGSVGAIYLAAALFVFTISGIGITVANNSSTMQQTMFVMFFFVMVFVLMSGLITPTESMPVWAQWITRFLPPKYFVEIMRSVYLKGASVVDLWVDYTALAAFTVVFNVLAAVTYKKRV